MGEEVDEVVEGEPEDLASLLQVVAQPAIGLGGAPAADNGELEEQITSISQEIAATLEHSQPSGSGHGTRGSGDDVGGGLDGSGGARAGGSGSPRDTSGRGRDGGAPRTGAKGSRGGARAGDAEGEIDRMLAEALGEDEDDFFPVPLRARRSKPEGTKRKLGGP
jgi:hypothetical protein